MFGVPHGGYVTSCFLSVAALHFHTTLSRQHQPHAITLHLEFLRRTSAGPATFTVRDIKLGRQTSTIHVALVQDGDREEVVGYITHTNMAAESGISLNTRWTLQPPPYALGPGGVESLANDEDEYWALVPTPFANFRHASKKYNMFLPRRGQLDRSIVDEYLMLTTGEKFTNLTLGSVVDTFPLMVEQFRVEHDEHAVERGHKKEKWPAFWYPTLSLDMEVKKVLPPEGVDLLFVRSRSKSIKNGRNDLEVVVLDEGGDMVAISHHVAFILNASRNTQARIKRGGKETSL